MQGDIYNIDLHLSYRDFMVKNNIAELSPVHMENWTKAIINNYQYNIEQDPIETMNFFRIPDTEENRADIMAKRYNVNARIVQNNTDKKILTIKVTLTMTTSQIILPN